MSDVVSVQARAKVKRGTEKCAYFADVTIVGFGQILGCPVWKKDGVFRVGLPQRQGKTQSFDLLRLEEYVETALQDAVVEACKADEAKNGPVPNSQTGR